MTINEWAHGQLGVDIWEKKYKNGNETFEEWLDRVSDGDEDLKELIKTKKFLFGGRILASRGLQKKGKKITYSNCFVNTPPSDDLESIYDTAKKMARTYSFGGGVGVDISKLRPKNAKTNNAANNSTGAVSFMELYDMTTGLISQNGRRGALMLSLSCEHPDLEDFIKIKQQTDKITKANISIRVTDDFMKAVIDDKDWTMTFKVDSTGEVITKTKKARDLMKMIAEGNHNFAEPGFLYWDNINNWNLLSEDEEFEYAGVNPCFTGDMRLWTSDGYMPFASLDGKEISVIDINGKQSKGKVWCSGEKETIKLSFSNGEFITCTPDHIFMDANGNNVLAKDMKGNKPNVAYKQWLEPNLKYVKLGFMQGDGQLSRKNSTTHKCIEVNVGKKDSEIIDLFETFSWNKNGRAIYTSDCYDDLDGLGFCLRALPERTFPDTYDSWEKNEKASFLHGCYTANGSVIKHGRVAYKTTCHDFAVKLAGTLENDFGISCYITTNKPKLVKFSNGEYLCKESYDVNICRIKSIIDFSREINFYYSYKKEELYKMIARRIPYVTAITKNGVKKVYDFTEPNHHWGFVEGFQVHNCAEETLPAGGSCLLGSINLSEFVVNPFSPHSYFNYDEFYAVTALSTKALNNVLDEGLPLLPLQEQKDSVKNYRQIGLGIFGLADMFIKLGIRYGSEQSIDLSKKIGRVMINAALSQSALLAKDHGTYPKYKKEAVLSSPFFKHVADEHTKVLVEKYGLHNSQLLTCAPTGTLSTMIGVSGGIEPIFNYGYNRRTQSLHGEDVIYRVYTPIVEEYMKTQKITDEESLPSFFTNAMKLDWQERVNVQGAWQKYIDASISSTVNLPEETTVEEVEQIYIKAWEKGLKGITIYRDNCARSGILTQIAPTPVKTEEEEVKQLRRGEWTELPEDITYHKRKLRTGCGKLNVFLGYSESDGKIHDIYAVRSGSGGCEKSVQTTIIAMAGMLRLGGNIFNIEKAFNGTGGCSSFLLKRAKGEELSKGSSCGTAVLYAIKDFLAEKGAPKEATSATPTVKLCKVAFPDKEKIKQATFSVEEKAFIEANGELDYIKKFNKCPLCNDKLDHTSGCISCPSCGYSKCD